MTEKPDHTRPQPPSLPLRLAAGVIAAALAGGGAHIFIGGAIVTAVAAVFFGLGAFLTIGLPSGDGTAAGDGG